MSRNSLLIGGWVVATVLALVLGLQGVRAVSNSVTVHRPASLSPASVKAALQRADDASSSGSSSESESAASASSSSSSAVGQDDRGFSASSGATGPTVPPAPDDHGAAASDDSASSSVASSSSGSDGGSSGDGVDGDSHPDATVPPQDKTYQLGGGSVGVRFENGAAHLLWATPNSGYSVENRSDATTVEIRFRSAEHESRLKAYWDGGPRQEIEEND